MNDPSVRKADPSHVLLVSKDLGFLGALRTAVEERGVGTAEARAPSAAMSKLARGRHRVVVVDADGPPREAAALVRGIRKRFPDRVLLVAASNPPKSLLINLIHAGIQHFVPKPPDPVKTAEMIRGLCERHELARAVRGPRPDGERVGGQSGAARSSLGDREQEQMTNELLRKQLSQLTILYQMGRDISENENWSDALDRFLMALVNYEKAEGAALLLFSRDGVRLAPRSTFQVGTETLSRACGLLGSRWRENPRGFEIHSIESYEERAFSTCLERIKPWRLTVVPLRYRNLVWGFLVIEKRYRSNIELRTDYSFLTTIQTILAEEVANASYISELRQLGRFNEKVLDNVNSGVVTTDLEGSIVFWNRLASDMCPGLGSGARIHFDELFRVPRGAGGIFRSIMESDEDTQVLEVTYRGKNAVDSPGRLGITKMHDDNLNGTVLVGILEDLTEQKKLEAEVRRTDRLRVLGQLSAGVAHEIRNPLTGIATSAEVLANRLAGGEDKLKYVRAILEETSRLDEIVRNLLSFARPAKPQMRVCAPGEISERVVSLLSDQAAKKGIALRMRDELEGSVCMADSNQLSQVLLNLVLNSIDACDGGNTVEIFLTSEPDAEGRTQGSVRIDVVDDGPGVSLEIRERLFEPFVTTKTQGTGLGLAISQQIVEEHHGEIRCEFLDKGTRFTIRLPRGAVQTAVTGRSR
jgi:signal transduction histidine kinase/DNA-binding response OmpR family regulator